MLNKMGASIAKFFGDEHADQTSDFSKIFTKMCQFDTISDLFPYFAFNSRDNIFSNIDNKGFVLEVSGLIGASHEMQKEISNIFTMLLPEKSSLQVILYADSNIEKTLQEYCAKRQGIFADLAKRRAEHLRNFKGNMAPLRNFRIFVCVSVPDEFETKRLINLREQIQRTFEMLNMGAFAWDADDLLQTMDSILHNVKNSDITYNPYDPLPQQFMKHDSKLSVTPNTLFSDKKQIRTYTVSKFPTFWSLHSMLELIGDMERDQAQIPCPFLFSYGVHITRQNTAQILAKAKYVEKQAYSPIGKYLPDIQREAEELDFVRDQINKGEKVVQACFNIVLLANKDNLESAEQTLMNLFISKEWRLNPNQYTQLPMFLTSLPMMWGIQEVKALNYLKKLKTTLSLESANLLPLQTEWRGTKTPGMLLFARRGQIMTWSPFDNNEGNYNVSVVGKSGSGKSVFMQELMVSTLGLGGRVFVIDVGRSFEHTAKLLYGEYLEFQYASNISLNPFSRLESDDMLAMLRSVLGSMAAPTAGVTDKQAALLEEAMLKTWIAHNNQSTINLIAEYLKNYADEDANNLAKMLFPYTKDGQHGKFFEPTCNVDLNHNLVVIELEELKEKKDLQSVVMQMMILQITNQMFLGDRSTPFMIVLDEAWDLLRAPGSFIETLARRLRKYNGSLVVGTQSVNDFYVNPAAQAAFDNSDWLCLLSQKPESVAQLKKSSRIILDEEKERMLHSVRTKQGEYAEVMISGSNGYSVGRLLLDPFSNLLYSTKADEFRAINVLMQQGMSVSEAVETLLKRRSL